MPDFKDLFDRWRQLDWDAYHEASQELWMRHYPTAIRYVGQFRVVDRDLAADLAAGAYLDTLEELDLQISSGGLLTTEAFVERDDLTDPTLLAARLHTATDPFSTYLRGRLSQATQSMLQRFESSSRPSDELVLDIVDVLNAALRDDALYYPHYVPQGNLPAEVQQLLDQRQLEEATSTPLKPLIEANRRLFEAIYPDAITVWDRRPLAVRGILTARALGPRQPMQWRSEAQFLGLVRRIWIVRCLDRLRKWAPASTPLSPFLFPPEEGDHEGDTVDLGEPSELGRLSEILRAPHARVFDKAVALTWIRALSRASEQLTDHPACREVVEATRVYIKVKVAQCHPVWVTSCQGDITAMPLEAIQSIADTSIEVLVQDADLSAFDPSGREWRQFLLHVLFEDKSQDEKVIEARKFLEKYAVPNGDVALEAMPCDQVRAALGELVQSPNKFQQQFGRDSMAQRLAHLAACDACVLALGQTVVARRTRNALDNRIRLCLPLIIQVFLEFMKGNEACQN